MTASVRVLIILLFLSSFSWGQTEKQLVELEELNTAAFSALENDEKDVSIKTEQLLEKSQETDSKKHEINAYTILGIVNKNKGYYVTSINHHIKALSVAEKDQDEGRISSCYSNIGSVYQLQENYPRALEYFQKSLKLEEKLDQPLQKSIRLYNIGEVYKELDSLRIALSYFNNSLLIEQEHNNKEGIVYALLGIADVYLNIERYTDASIALDDARELITASDVEEAILFHHLRGKLFARKGLIDQAYEEFKRAEEISNTNKFRVHLLDIYTEEIDILNTQQKWQASVERYQTYIELKNELNNIKVKNQLEDLTFQHALNSKELEIQLIKEERDLAKKNEQSEKTIAHYEQKIVWFLISSLLVVLALIVYGIKRITKQA